MAEKKEKSETASDVKQAKTKSRLLQSRDVTNELVEGERIIKQGKIHWAIFLFPAVTATLSLLVGIFLSWVISITMFIAIVMVPFVRSLILYLTTQLVVTNKRVLARYGFFSRDLIQVRMDRMETASLIEPFVGQLLGYSTVVVSGTGTGTITMPFIAQGHVLTKGLQEYVIKRSDDKADIK